MVAYVGIIIGFVLFLINCDTICRILIKKIYGKQYEKHVASVQILEYFSEVYHENHRENDELTKMLQWCKNLDEKDIVKYNIKHVGSR